MIRLSAAAAVAFAFATPALAGPFDGTWKLDMTSFKASTKPYTRLLANGHYHCTCSNPPEDFPVDGKFHKVTGHTGYDEAMGQVVDAKSVHLAYKRDGKTQFDVTSTLSDEGKTVHETWTDTSAPKTVTGEDEAIRVGPAPKGAHAISGTWRDSDKTTVSDAGAAVTLAEAGGKISVQWSDGTHYTPTIGGPAVKVEGVNSGAKVAVARKGLKSLVFTGRTAAR